MKYYVYERFTETNVFSGKYVRFVDDPSVLVLPANTTTEGYTAEKPELFLPPNIPYAKEKDEGGFIIFDEWEYKQGPQNYYTITSGNAIAVKKNSVYTFADPIDNLNISILNDEKFLEETSVFFTFDNSSSHTVNFPSNSKVIGSIEYWVSGKSYIITVYNGYYIIGVSRVV